MKRFYLSTLSAGLALAIMGGPMAMAQQQQYHEAPATHLPPTHAMEQHPPIQMSHPMMQSHADIAPNHAGGTPDMSHGHDWRQGDHYNGDRRVVSNWGHYHLRQPPSGYEWVQDDNGQFILIAVTSGIIADIIANSLQ